MAIGIDSFEAITRFKHCLGKMPVINDTSLDIANSYLKKIFFIFW